MKPICVPCQRFMRMKRSGYYFIEAMPANGVTRPAPGRAEPHNWRPYKVWSGDLWGCPDCGVTIISGVGLQPIDEHYRPTFAATVKDTGADRFQVNDC
jgi:hypothetical protein